MNIPFIEHLFVGCMVSEIPMVPTETRPYSLTFPYTCMFPYIDIIYRIRSIM